MKTRTILLATLSALLLASCAATNGSKDDYFGYQRPDIPKQTKSEVASAKYIDESAEYNSAPSYSEPQAKTVTNYIVVENAYPVYAPYVVPWWDATPDCYFIRPHAVYVYRPIYYDYYYDFRHVSWWGFSISFGRSRHYYDYTYDYPWYDYQRYYYDDWYYPYHRNHHRYYNDWNYWNHVPYYSSDSKPKENKPDDYRGFGAGRGTYSSVPSGSSNVSGSGNNSGGGRSVRSGGNTNTGNSSGNGTTGSVLNGNTRSSLPGLEKTEVKAKEINTDIPHSTSSSVAPGGEKTKNEPALDKDKKSIPIDRNALKSGDKEKSTQQTPSNNRIGEVKESTPVNSDNKVNKGGSSQVSTKPAEESDNQIRPNSEEARTQRNEQPRAEETRPQRGEQTQQKEVRVKYEEQPRREEARPQREEHPRREAARPLRNEQPQRSEPQRSSQPEKKENRSNRGR